MIVRSLTGEELLAVTEGDLERPDADRALYKSDVLSFLNTPVTQFALVAIGQGRPTMDSEPNLVEDGEQMHFDAETFFTNHGAALGARFVTNAAQGRGTILYATTETWKCGAGHLI